MGTACTKNVGEVAGTNKKPWRQKGTGRARAGSFQSPLWRGGGVVFGPKPRDFSKKVSRSTRQLALRKALSERLKAGDVLIVDDLKLASPKTRDFLGVLAALEVKGTALIVSARRRHRICGWPRATSPNVELTTGDSLNTYQVLRSDKLVFTRGAFEKSRSGWPRNNMNSFEIIKTVRLTEKGTRQSDKFNQYTVVADRRANKTRDPPGRAGTFQGQGAQGQHSQCPRQGAPPPHPLRGPRPELEKSHRHPPKRGQDHAGVTGAAERRRLV